MSDVLLTLNAGSSSVKFAVFLVCEPQMEMVASGQIEGLGATAHFKLHPRRGQSGDTSVAAGHPLTDHTAAVGAILSWLEQEHGDARVAAVGHRVVHGGVELLQPAIVDAEILAVLRRLVPLAPLHQPHNISGILAATAAFPDALQVACFDTAFHRSHPFTADAFALPRRYYDEGVRRYGFHGLSYEFISERLRALFPQVAAGRVIVAHLGNGASLCGMHDGKSIDSTMGFTALDGLPMGTRCGQLDPGVVLYLISQRGMDANSVSDLLYKESGLKGLSGISQDMRQLEADGSQASLDAIAYFVARIRREIGGLAASLGGVDAIVFTGGIGENSRRVRAAVLSELSWIGADLDRHANDAGAQVISTPKSKVVALVMKTDEERMIAQHTAEAARVSGAFATSHIASSPGNLMASPV